LLAVPLDVDDTRRNQLATTLSHDEIDRAKRFHFDRHRNRFIVARGRLRELLGSLLSISGSAITFDYGAHGKPQLAAAFATTGLRFNISHSGNLALLGLSWQRDLGVDVEYWRALADEEALARRFFSPTEVQDYLRLEPSLRSEGFFNCWTRKEAYVKAVGRGLGLSLDSFDVSLAPGDPPRLRRPSALLDDGRTWSLATVELGAQCSAAVVLEGEACHIAEYTLA
jgi:4'-phosphopantetheinyl transferase